MTNISNREELQKLIEKYVKGSANEEEKIFLEMYYDQFENDRDGISQLSELQKSRIKNEMENAIHQNVQMGSSRKLNFSLYKVAVSVLILIASGLVIWQSIFNDSDESTVIENDIFLVSDTAELTKEHIYLSDGSYILLSPGSVLSYKKTFDDKIREVELDGEAFFDIHRDTLRPFIVHSNGVNTRVLGTSFTVSSYNDRDSVTVSVSRGKVQVSGKSGRAEILEKDDQVIVNRNSMEVIKRKLDADEVKDIEPEKFVMNDMKVGNAVKMVSKRWNSSVILGNEELRGCRFTSSFTRGDSLEDVVAVICAVIGAEYKIENNIVYLTGTGCK